MAKRHYGVYFVLGCGEDLLPDLEFILLPAISLLIL
jgi:hypothetical protein